MTANPAHANPASTGNPANPVDAERVLLVEQNQRLVTTYRWPRWMPWTVVGGGVAVGVVSAVIQISASSLFNQYDQDIAASCAVNGCNLENPQTESERALADRLNGQRETAETRQTIGFVTMLGAGAVLVTGIVLVVLNRPENQVLRVDLVPAPGGATASVGFRF